MTKAKFTAIWDKDDFDIEENKITGLTRKGFKKLNDNNGKIVFPKFEGVDTIEYGGANFINFKKSRKEKQ